MVTISSVYNYCIATNILIWNISIYSQRITFQLHVWYPMNKNIYKCLDIIIHRKYHWCVQYYHRVYVQLSVRVFVYNTNDISLFKVLRRFEVYLMYDNILIDYSPALVPLFLFNQLFYYLHLSVVYGWYGFSQYCHKNEWTPTWYFRFCIIIWYVCFS